MIIGTDNPNFGIKEYKIYGSKQPSPKEISPQIFCMSIFATNELVARSRFFKVLKSKYKIKSSQGIILSLKEEKEDLKEMAAINYGINFVYRDRRGKKHNMYKEFRAVSRCDAVASLNGEMAGRHKVKKCDIFVVSIKVLEAEDLKRLKVIEFADPNVQFPIFKKELALKEDLVPKGSKIFE